jgi:glycosyltransferase involved in cell wall biosynthesis
MSIRALSLVILSNLPLQQDWVFEDKMKLIFRSHFDIGMSFGKSSAQLVMALERAGVDVYPIVEGISLNQPRKFVELLTKSDPGYVDVFLTYLAPESLNINEKTRRHCTLAVGYSMVEQTSIYGYLYTGGVPHSMLDALIVPCSMNIKPFQEFAPGIPIYVVPLGADTDFYYYKPRKKRSVFKFCQNGALGHRKGTFEVIEAFKELKKDHPDWKIELHLKTSTDEVPQTVESWCPGIKCYAGYWSAEKLRKFYWDMDVMVCPSRGEGFHLPPVEFLATGGGVIATNWGGHKEWLSPKYAYPLRFSLREVTSLNGSTVDPKAKWAEPNRKHLKELMAYCYLHQDEVKKKGRIGSQVVRDKFTWDEAARKLIKLFDYLLSKKPNKKMFLVTEGGNQIPIK